MTQQPHSLPRKPSPETDRPASSPPSQTILILTDEEDLRTWLADVVRDQGFEVAAADSGRQALAWLKTHDCQLALIDSKFVDTGRPELWQRLKARQPAVAVILIAGPASPQDTGEALRRGAAGYVTRPLEPGELVFAIRRALDFHRLRQEHADLAQAFEARNEALDEARRRAAQLETLHQINQRLGLTTTLEETLQAIHYHARALSQAEYCRVFLHPVQPAGHDRSDPKQAEARFARKLARQAAKTQTAVQWPGQNSSALASWLALPLISSQKVLGVLCLGHRQPEAFGADRLRLLTGFADLVAMALENAYIFQDLSGAYLDLAQSRAEILNNRNTLQALFDGITEGLYIVDENLTVLAVNQAEARRLGKPIAQIEGKTCTELGWTEAAPDLIDVILERFASGQPAHWIPAEQKPPHLFTDREVHLYPVRDRQRRVDRVILLAQDVSERKRLQATLFQSANLAALGRLATSVAHEINNPLTVAVANSQLMLMELPESSDQREAAQAIYEAGQRIQHIIANLVEFSNQETYHFSQVDLIDTLEASLALVVHPLRKAAITITKSFASRPRLVASNSHLKMVWMNLLLNARDAIAETRRPGRIEIRVAQADESAGTVAVSIGDNGAGISTDDYRQLFRPFFTTKASGEALGLGLFTAHTIVERHQGQITIESEKGRGTTVTVTLPLHLSPPPSPLET